MSRPTNLAQLADAMASAHPVEDLRNNLDKRSYLPYVVCSLDDVIAGTEVDRLGGLLTSVGLKTKQQKGQAPVATTRERPGYDLLTGRTFEMKEYLKTLGARWDPAEKGWWVPTIHMDRVREVMRTNNIPMTDTLVCWECGHSYTLQQMVTRPGADPASWYCGCSETVVTERRRPNFGRSHNRRDPF